VESLLAAHDEAGSFGNAPVFAAPADRLEPGALLGPYRIEALIGAGGPLIRAHTTNGGIRVTKK
jgi:serine/threonine-protein kinase